MLHLHCITLFEQEFKQFLFKGVIKRGYESELFKCTTYDLRHYGVGKHRQIDDYPFSEKKGMLLRADVVYDAITSIEDYQNMRIIYTCPKGPVYTQSKCNELFRSSKPIILIAGYFEGIDERIFECLPIERVSIGDFIVNSGDCAMAVIAESLIRQVDGVLGNKACIEDDSHFNTLLEAPQYTQPLSFKEQNVPEIYRSGHHQRIAEYKLKESIKQTLIKRSDLLGTYPVTNQEKKMITQIINEMAEKQ